MIHCYLLIYFAPHLTNTIAILIIPTRSAATIMRPILFTLFLVFYASCEETTEIGLKLIKLCDFCTCSEIREVNGGQLVFNILCSETDRIRKQGSDLDKIAWPPNTNGLRIAASFEGLGLTTLGKLPPNSQVETLRFTNNAIRTYWPDPFNDVPNLKKLSFSQNELWEITPDLFTNVQSLEELDLSYNKLTDFSSLIFRHLRSVKVLNLKGNALKMMPIEALHPMASLEDLDLSKNNINYVALQKNYTVQKGLKRLCMKENRIRAVMKDSFPAENSIEFLDLSYNVIEMVEEDAFLTCTSLRELNLEGNSLALIFALPPSLEIAILKINTFHHWPKFPRGIKYIDLSYNKLTDVYDESQVRFDNLEVLNIGGNQIKELNIQKKLPKLFIIDISYNLLTEIPKTLSTQFFPNLEELHLDGNPIEDIYFKNIIALKNLYISDLSKLRVVEDKAFSNVVGRGDETGDMYCFSLYLSSCPFLTEIKESAFDGTSLCMLDISKNSLSYISRNLLNWTSVTEGVNLQHNPWNCSCQLQWMEDQLLPIIYSTDAKLLDELRCRSPKVLEGVRFVHWYKWPERALCSDLRSSNYMLAPSSEAPVQISLLQIILGCAIIITLCIAIGLCVYLVKTRKRHRSRRPQKVQPQEIRNGSAQNDELKALFNKA